MIPVLVSFFPPAKADLYLPALFKFWEATNSNIVDERMIELIGALSEEHIAGAGHDSGVIWKDVGIWTHNQWSLFIGKALGSMSTLLCPSTGVLCTYATLRRPRRLNQSIV